MGDPHNVVGLSYNVGTCQAQGVGVSQLPHRCGRNLEVRANQSVPSLPPAPEASSARRPARVSSSRTATPATPTAAPATTPTLTSSTSTSTASRRWPSSRSWSMPLKAWSALEGKGS
jgi:hypothetical protein